MNNHVNSIASRLSLRHPQRRSLEILARVLELSPPKPEFRSDVQKALAAIRGEFPHMQDFERDFPSLCFALATGVGKTRLMGAFISYLYLEHGVRNFFVLAPNLTIYNKLITDFTPNTSKYVFRGVEGFAINPPHVITGDNYTSQAPTLFDQPEDCVINVFNISKINSEVRGGKQPRIRRLSEYLGQSYFDYLAKLPDLVLLMDESHRYRASAGVRAINELQPVLGLELTATPFVESTRGPVWFKNVIYEYSLARAMEDGFVKEPAVVTRKDFQPTGMTAEEVERMKLEDGIRLHEQVKVELETYARQMNERIVKPFMLVIARDTTHASALFAQLQNEDGIYAGRYKGRVIQVDSSKTGKEEDEMIQRLLDVENPNEPTEIVIHVNMLKEGWDVTNLYTIVPLRAANARTLIEQSIGRGLRLPYGKRTGLTREYGGKKVVHPVDRLNIVAHDKFQEIVDDARRLDSPLQLQFMVLDPEDLAEKPRTEVSKSKLAQQFEEPAATPKPYTPPPLFQTPEERAAGRIAFEVMQEYQNKPTKAPTAEALKSPKIQEEIVVEVKRRMSHHQQTIPGMESVNIADVVSKTAEQVVKETINIPRINVTPVGTVRTWYDPFVLDLSSFGRLPVPSQALHVQTLRTGEREIITTGSGGIQEKHLADYIIARLIDFDDISYDEHAELLYELAEKVVNHFKTEMNYSDEDIRKVLAQHAKLIAESIHVQMNQHYRTEASGYQAVVARGFMDLKESAYTATSEAPHDFRSPVQEKTRITQMVFVGFEKCLFPTVKFQSDTERKMAVILDRDSLRWFRPARDQFQIEYQISHESQLYQPDFVAETDKVIYMIETKAASSINDADVQAKKSAGLTWCKHASDYAIKHDGKPWQYLLIPHDKVNENMSLDGLAAQYSVLPVATP